MNQKNEFLVGSVKSFLTVPSFPSPGLALALFAASALGASPSLADAIAASTPNSAAHAQTRTVHGKIPLMGKPSAAVDYTYDVTGSGVPGSPVTVKLGVVFREAADDVQLTLKPGEGLQAGSGDFTVSLGKQAAHTTVYRTVTVIPSSTELSYLHVHLKGLFSGSPMGRVGSVPVNANAGASIQSSGSAKTQVGTVTVNQNKPGNPGRLLKDSDGGNVISMPATETKHH